MNSYYGAEQTVYDDLSDGNSSIYFADTASNNGDFMNGDQNQDGFENGLVGSEMNDLAELERMVGLERAELNDLATACEDLDRAIEEYDTLSEALEQQFREIDVLMEEFTTSFAGLEVTIKKIQSGNESISVVKNLRDQAITSRDNEFQKILRGANELLESTAAKLREAATSKKAAENRYAADMAELGNDIKNMRSSICGIEKLMSEDRNRLNALKEEMAKLTKELEQSDNALNEATQKYDSLQRQLDDLMENEKND